MGTLPHQSLGKVPEKAVLCLADFRGWFSILDKQDALCRCISSTECMYVDACSPARFLKSVCLFRNTVSNMVLKKPRQ